MRKIVSALALLASIASAATVATVNGEKIDSEDLDMLLARNGVTYEQLNDQQKQQILDQAIEQKLVVQAAKKAGLEKSDEYKRALALAQDAILSQVYSQNKFNSISISDSEAKKVYKDKEKELVRKDEEVCARHILIKESEGEAKSIITALGKKKEKELLPEFEKLAKEKSQDESSAARGGDLGCFKQDTMVKEFSEAAFKQKAGTVSKTPIKSDFGYHIIYVSDHKKAGAIPFDEIKDQLKNFAKQEKFQEAMEKEIKDLRAKAKID